MINKNTILKTFQSYNLYSHKYGPTIYENNNTYGICLDFKDSTFGYLTRVFTFDDTKLLDEFLQKYFWYKNNSSKYPLTLSLDTYDTPIANLKITYNNKDLTLNDMLNLKDTLKNTKETIINNDTKNAYLLNIEYLTKYLITLKNTNYNLKNTKNNLKIQENDLKFTLLTYLTEYYGKTRTIEKKAVSLENAPLPSNDISLLQNNLTNIKTKTLPEIESYLKTLINLVKEEELNEKNLINIYSNNIYEYNIEILKKQIEFVKNKITAEKNFNLKGSKIHNIDEELKSFLNATPPKIEVFLNTEKTKLQNKYNALTDITHAYSIISGNTLDIKTTPLQEDIIINPLADLNTKFNSLDDNTKNSLILYNSFYKDICNYLIDNNYPSLEDIKNNFDFNYYYHDLDEIIHNEHNSHYLINYFNIINFKTIDTYLESLINIAKTLENTHIITSNALKAFAISKTTKYQELSLNPLFTNELTYIINIPSNTDLIYIPTKIELNEANELDIVNIKSIFYAGTIKNTNNLITVNKYNKINQEDPNNAIIITTELTLNSSTTFYEGELV